MLLVVIAVSLESSTANLNVCITLCHGVAIEIRITVANFISNDTCNACPAAIFEQRSVWSERGRGITCHISLAIFVLGVCCISLIV